MQNSKSRSFDCANEIRVVLFDVGGVLVQLDGINTLLNWLGNKMTVDALWHMWLNSPAVRSFETGRSDAMTFARSLVKELGVKITPEVFLEAFIRWPVGLYPNTLAMLAGIPRKYSRALLSNSNSLHWSRVRDDMGLGAAIEHHFVSHLMGKIKPDVEAFEHVIEVLQCSANEILFLDDNALNVEAASDVGMRAVKVLGGEAAQAALIASGILSR